MSERGKSSKGAMSANDNTGGLRELCEKLRDKWRERATPEQTLEWEMLDKCAAELAEVLAAREQSAAPEPATASQGREAELESVLRGISPFVRYHPDFDYDAYQAAYAEIGRVLAGAATAQPTATRDFEAGYLEALKDVESGSANIQERLREAGVPRAERAQPTSAGAVRDPRRWEIVRGETGLDDDWGIRGEGEKQGQSVAQMVWKWDAEEIVKAHNAALEAARASVKQGGDE